ncbi:MAG: helix-turn-helix domain-containing protein [Rikenellaceae bacterium]
MKKHNNKLNIQENVGLGQHCKISFISDIVIFRCVGGEATILLNDNECRFSKGTNFIVIEPTYTLIKESSDDFQYVAIIFERKTFNKIYTHIDSAILNTLKYSAPDLGSHEHYRHTELTLEKLILLNNSELEHQRMIMRSLIFCYIFEMYDLSQNYMLKNSVENSKFKDSLIGRFIILCREHHTEHRDIAFYSEKLSISRRYLHTLVVAKMHVTPKEFIDGYVITSAKKMLLNSTKTSQQIADELNFPDQSTFGQFFKRITSLSPSQFYKKHSSKG